MQVTEKMFLPEFLDFSSLIASWAWWGVDLYYIAIAKPPLVIT